MKNKMKNKLKNKHVNIQTYGVLNIYEKKTG